jgi:hypothetical protein
MFKHLNYKKYLLGLSASIFALAVKAVSAAPEGLTSNMKKLGDAAKYSTDTVTEKSIFSLVGMLIGVFLQVLGVIFVILFIVAGYHWMMAGGDTAKIDKAKDSMWRAIIGLLIIIGSYAIEQYVFSAL